MKSGYFLAGGETLATILDNFLLGKKGRLDNQFTRDQISNFLGNSISGILHSFGQNFKGKKKYTNYIKQEGDLFRKCRDTGFFNNSIFLCDSGGFQISIGSLSRKESELLFDLYYKFLVEQYDVYDRAFILDIPPGPNCEIFYDFNDVYSWNNKSYNIARQFPKEVRDKIIYIHHFRTPELWRIFTNILHNEDMFNSFNFHGTGGIVANASSDTQIPCLIYILPLIPLLNQAKKYGRKYLNFHVLGGANFRDVLIYELFRKHVLEVHGIELNITYDSSGIFKGIMIGRKNFIYDNGVIRKLDLRSNGLHLRYNQEKKINDKIEEIIDDLCKKYNMGVVQKPFEVYDKNRNTFHEDIKVYIMLHALDLYSVIQEEMRKFVDNNYDLYKSGNTDDFSSNMEMTIRNLNGGNITNKQISKSNSVIRSLELLKTLDEDYCKSIVNKFLSKDEFTNLIDEKKVLGF